MQFLKMPKLKEFVSSFCLFASAIIAELQNIGNPRSILNIFPKEIKKELRVKINSNIDGMRLK